MDPISTLTLLAAVVYPWTQLSKLPFRSKKRRAILDDVQRDVSAVLELARQTEEHHQGTILKDFPPLKHFCDAYMELRDLSVRDSHSALQRAKLEAKWGKFKSLVKTMKKTKANFEVAVQLDEQR